MNLQRTEEDRQRRQSLIDAAKSTESRRRMGQFATPNDLAKSIVRETRKFLGRSSKLNVLEPSMGTGSFVSASLAVLGKRVTSVRGYELDPDFHAAAVDLWGGGPVQPILGDFTKTRPEPLYDIVVANPPYSRHHALSAADKRRLQTAVFDAAGVHISGLAGLYCHFLLLSVSWMKKGAVGAWLIPSEWMSVNYGEALRKFLSEKVALLRVHRFAEEDVRFSDALVSSCVVWLRNEAPHGGGVEFTYGSSLENPDRRETIPLSSLSPSAKWPPRSKTESRWRLGDFFSIRRGLVTGDNGFFVMKEAEASERGIPTEFLKPILPSPRHLKVDHVKSDADGLPVNADRRYLLDCTGYSMDELPLSVRRYLMTGAETTAHKRLCAARNVWYEQEKRVPTPFLCSYMGRGSGDAPPVRFILNDTRAIASNSFLMMYPRGELAKLMRSNPECSEMVWSCLLRIPGEQILSAGRSYGGGLRKVEPRELASVPCEALSGLLRADSHSGMLPGFD